MSKGRVTMKSKQREARLAWLFIGPYTIGFGLFYFAPALISLLVSTTNLRFVSKLDNVRFVGLGNYIEMLTNKDFWNAVGNSMTFTAFYVPVIMVVGLALAIMINQRIYVRNFIRTLFFMPYVSNMVAIAIVWSVILDPMDGVINSFLQSIGIANPPMWLMSTDTALITVVLISVWQGVGLQFVTYLAALQGVPGELKEAAAIDGANKWQVFRNVTLPSIAPTSFLVLITSIIVSFKNFTIIQVMTDGGPGTSTTILPLSIIEAGFSTFRLGYASAQAMFLFLIMMTITLIQWRGQKKIVY